MYTDCYVSDYALQRLTKFSQQKHEVDIIFFTHLQIRRLSNKSGDLHMVTQVEGGRARMSPQAV